MNMSENIKLRLEMAWKIGQMGTWGSEIWDTGRFSWGQYDSTISAHDESQGEFGEGAKLAIWIDRTVGTGKISFFVNGMTLAKCEDRFVKTWKLTHL